MSKPRGRPPKYPWDEWGDGETHVAFRGTDFHTDPRSFRALVHRSANTRGLRAETVIKGDQVIFRFYE